MRVFGVFLISIVLLNACASRPKWAEDPLPRTQYQKVNTQSFVGAASAPNSPPLTARGNRYQTGKISSAAADWSRWPAGTLFRVLATGELFEVDDFTDDIVGTNTILLYKPSSARMPGTASNRFVTIEIIRWGSPQKSIAILEGQRSSTSKRILAELKARYPQRR